MNARFELICDDSDRVRFRLLDTDGHALLTGGPTNGKITAQNQVLHARSAIRDDRFLPQSDNGEHFVILQDKDGSDLAKSAKVKDESELPSLIAMIRECGAAISFGSTLCSQLRLQHGKCRDSGGGECSSDG